MICEEKIINISFANQKGTRGVLHCLDIKNLPVACETLVECIVSDVKTCPREATSVYIHTWEAVFENYGIRVAKGIGTMNDNRITIAISNFSNKLVTLPRGTVVASFETIDPNDWDVINLNGKRLFSQKSQNGKQRI